MRIFLVIVFALLTTELSAQSELKKIGDTITHPPAPPPAPALPALPNLLQPPGNTPPVPGGPMNVSCTPDQLLAPLKAAEKLIETQAEQIKTQAAALKTAADQLKEVNEQLKNAATNLGQAQLNLIKKTVDEAGTLLLNPFKPLIDFVNEYIPNIKWIKEKLEKLGWQIVAIAGLVIGFLIGFPFWVFIRRITPGPGRKAA